MEWVKEVLNDPDALAALGYGAAITTASAYAAYKNDFGASDKTTKELENYIEDECGLTNPLAAWKSLEYRRELESREDLNESSLDDVYESHRTASAVSDD